MCSTGNILNIYAVKLCLTPGVLKKAEELLRLLELKTASGCSLAISEACRAVICLDLAAASLGVRCEKAGAIKLSGVKKPVYLCSYHVVKKLLGLNEQLHVKDLCVRLDVEEAASLASQLVDSFLAEKPSDSHHPMYPTVAVLAACRHLKLRVDKRNLVEMSGLKRSAFDSLFAEFGKILERVAPPGNRMAKKRTHVLADVIQNSIKASQKTMAAEKQDESESGLEPPEDYNDWKKRILLQASSGHQPL
ncbi:origin recognition complex subunit 6 [Bacillus rossius redtenbacheri]|uniref:origin recognition complex subunit 6 n=1 Tax=Bacillus rossius redtenbacheri TaxID=93214 RepID=UPI002FDD83E4